MTAAIARVLAPLAALAAVHLLDLVLAARPWPTAAVALFDWPAHLLTAWLLLTAAGVRSGRLLSSALAGAVLIDLDHVPLYLGADVTAGGGRPVTHSLTTVLVLLAVAGAWPSQRSRIAGLAVGVGLHLVRDIALGPGVPLLWPLVAQSSRVAWTTYLGVLVLATAGACWRAWRGWSRPVTRPGRLRSSSGSLS